MTTNEKEILNLIFDGLVAVGTILLAIIAIYGERVKRWLFKPKITAEIKNESPYIDKIQKDRTRFHSRLSIVENNALIKLKIQNVGKTTAVNCQGIVEQIWKKRDTNESYYLLRTITPTQLDWHDDSKVFNITPHIPSYLEIGRIQQIDIRTQEKESTIKTVDNNSCDLFLAIEEPSNKGVYIRLGKGTFIIPVVIYADNLSTTQKYYVQIYWNGKNPTELDDSVFFVSILDENKIPKNIIK